MFSMWCQPQSSKSRYSAAKSLWFFLNYGGQELPFRVLLDWRSHVDFGSNEILSHATTIAARLAGCIAFQGSRENPPRSRS